MSAPLACDGIRLALGGRPVLDGVTCAFPAGRFSVVVGPSGAGKSSLLRVCAGLQAADAGTVRLGETVCSDPAPRVPPAARRIGMVFQSLGLWPHQTAEGHVAFVLAARGVPRAARAGRARELLALVGLADRAGARPAELSGGEQQRVALARALAGDPAVLLLDEPFGSLDASLRARLREAVRDVQRRLGLTACLVTHDQDEALALADHLLVMRGGRIEQAGAPTDVWRRPATRFVAEFLGCAVLAGSVAGGRVTTALGTVDAAGLPDGPVLAAVRPEGLRLGEGSGGGAGTARTSTFVAGRYVVDVTLADGSAVRVASDAAPADGAAVRVAFASPPHFLAGNAHP